MENPFATLGIAPGVLKGLSDEQIAGLVRAMYHALSAIHHPDKGGLAKDFQRISAAAEQLRSPSIFLDWKEQHLRPLKDQKRAVAMEAQAEASRRRATEQRLCDFWEAFAGIPSEKGLSVFHLPPTLFLVADVKDDLIRAQQMRDDGASAVARAHMRNFASQSQRRYERRTPSSKETEATDRTPIKQKMFHLRVDGEGRITRFSVERVWFSPSPEHPPADIPREWIWQPERNATRSNSYYWKRIGDGEELSSVRIVGFLDLKLLDRLNEERGSLVSPERILPWQCSARVDSEDYAQARKGYLPHLFRSVLPFLSPIGTSLTMLIGVEECDRDPHFLFLGYVVKILSFL